MQASGEPVLGIFAKWPTLGAVKTRLFPGDPERGTAAAAAFLADTLDRLASVRARRILVADPPARLGDFAALATGRYEVEPQSTGDLGQRLATFFDRHADAPAVVAVGTDSPTLPVEYVERALCDLRDVDVVLGPATDGGYYLVGCGSRRPPIFDGIRWSSAAVLADTLAQLTDPDWRLALLPPWYDVDSPDDWQLLCGHVAALHRAGQEVRAPRTESLTRASGRWTHPFGIT